VLADDVVFEAPGGMRGEGKEACAATGRPVKVDYIQVLRCRNGKHVSFHLMFDRLLMLEQLGLIPAPNASG
jgi:ketosteroid isomerase-like protein